MLPTTYLDNNASTMVDSRVVKKMNKFYRDFYGNPSCGHILGIRSKYFIDEAKAYICDFFDSISPDEIYFTSGATESNNLALIGYILGLAERGEKGPFHIITSKIEHPCIIKTCEFLEKFYNCDVTYLDVNYAGVVNVSDVMVNVKPNTKIVSIMGVNNEVGSIQPVHEISGFCKENNIVFHSDIAQAVGKTKINVSMMDMFSVSGHKIYGPKGVGILYIAKNINIHPIMNGGGQQKNIRSGTENVPGIVGIGEAFRVLKCSYLSYNKRISNQKRLLVDFIGRLCSRNLVPLKINNQVENSVCNTINFSLPGTDMKRFMELMMNDKICISSGSACSEGKPDPSYVLMAMTNNKEIASTSIRVSLGKYNDSRDLEKFLNSFNRTLKILRSEGKINITNILS